MHIGYGLKPAPRCLDRCSASVAENQPKDDLELAERYRLPAIYGSRFFAADGGLISYGPDQIDQSPCGRNYVDRILRGEKPSDLPVQAPTKYELVINLKAAKALGLQILTEFSLRADEVIE